MADQLRALRIFYGDARLFRPVMVTWVASFGGALHEPVTQFFYQELGATPQDIGNLNSLNVLGTLVLAPAFGWALDNKQARTGMLLCASCCAVGCLIRGLAASVPLLYLANFVIGLGANLWTLVLAFAATSTHAGIRSVVVSGFIGQQRVMALAGKGLYPALHFVLLDVLAIDSRLLRFRVAMSVCTAFCIFGVAALSAPSHACKRGQLPAPALVEAPAFEEDADHHKDDDALPSSASSACVFVSVSLAILAQANFAACLAILWPLYLQQHFGWGSREYGGALFLASVAAISGIWAQPALERRLGQLQLACLSLLGAAASAFAAFGTDQEDWRLHVLSVLLLAGCLGLAEPCLKSLATLQMPRSLQGRAWGVLTSLQGIGSMLGSSTGGVLFRHDAALPFLVDSGLACAAAFVLYTTEMLYEVAQPGKRRSGGGGGGGGGSSGDSASAPVAPSPDEPEDLHSLVEGHPRRRPPSLERKAMLELPVRSAFDAVI